MRNKKVYLLVAGTVLLGSCIPVQAEEMPEGLVFVQELEEDSRAREVYAEILQDYTEHSGVEILWETYPEEEYRQRIEESFEKEGGPDIYTGSLGDMTEDFKNSRLHNFLYLYDEENPYNSQGSWAEGLSDYVKHQMMLSSLEIPGFPATAQVPRILCNAELFEKAGAEIPETWEELLKACQMLSDYGTVPFAFYGESYEEPAWKWLMNSLSGQSAGSLAGLLDVNEKDRGYVELNEFCKGIDKGIIDPGDNKILSSYDRMKELAAFWPEKAFDLKEEEALSMFARGEAAMVPADNHSLETMEEAVFSVKAIPIPVITGETDENAVEKSVHCGGEPEMIYGIRASLKKDGEKFGRAVDFVQYMTSVQVQQRLGEELGILPSDSRAALPEELQGFAVTEEPLINPFFTGVSEEQSRELWEILRGYSVGEFDYAGLTEKLRSSYKDGVAAVRDAKGWSMINNYGIPSAADCTMCEP